MENWPDAVAGAEQPHGMDPLRWVYIIRAGNQKGAPSTGAFKSSRRRRLEKGESVGLFSARWDEGFFGRGAARPCQRFVM